ncbi:MAG TPA: ParB/RepB/Spo0J family partition protein [Solirubrobacterales bacterium]|nr:ParB/RepB/Spo0J family partition protein [Solirubrobacterales bacterium]
MSVNPDPQTGNHLKDLKEIPVARIRKNDANPRIHFTPEEMERLTESIDRKGVLVPIVVYDDADGDGYVLTDGERRWRCASELGHESIPAIITDAPSPEENLVQMFNIHMVREAWKDMPTARALGRVIEELGIQDNRELADATGLSLERIKRLRHALTLPPEYQEYIDTGNIPLNFFWELKRNVIDPLASKRPGLTAEFGDSEVLDSFVNKRINGVITDVVSLRMVTPIINFAAREVEDPMETSPLDETIRSLVKDPEKSVTEAYEDTVQVVFETEKLERRADNVVKSFERLLGKARTDDEKGFIQRVGLSLANRITRLVS